jgi:hypothetical protein
VDLNLASFSSSAQLCAALFYLYGTLGLTPGRPEVRGIMLPVLIPFPGAGRIVSSPANTTALFAIVGNYPFDRGSWSCAERRLAGRRRVRYSGSLRTMSLFTLVRAF